MYLEAAIVTPDLIRTFNTPGSAWKTYAEKTVNTRASLLPHYLTTALLPQIWNDASCERVAEMTTALIDTLSSRIGKAKNELDTCSSAKDPVAPTISPVNLRRFPELQMLAFNALDWRVFDQKDRPKTLRGLALQCFFLYRLYKRAMQHALVLAEGRTLRRSFMDLVSAAFQPSALDQMAMGLGGRGQDPRKHQHTRALWDEDLVDLLLVDIPAPRTSCTDLPQLILRLDAAKRWGEATADVRRVVDLVMKLPCAQAGTGKSSELESNVALTLDALTVVSTCAFRSFNRSSTHRLSLRTLFAQSTAASPITELPTTYILNPPLPPLSLRHSLLASTAASTKTCRTSSAPAPADLLAI